MIKKPNGEQAVGTREFRCLQLFRGLAALFVLLFHVDVISNLRFSTRFAGGHFSAGHLGVDFFFVLSGFIIWHVHAKDMGFAGRASSYLLKRVLRIWPLVLLLTTAKLGYMFFLGGAGVGAGKGSAEVVICSYFLLPVTESLGGKPLLDSAWTLPYEMLFYLAFAVGILFG